MSDWKICLSCLKAYRVWHRLYIAVGTVRTACYHRKRQKNIKKENLVPRKILWILFEFGKCSEIVPRAMLQSTAKARLAWKIKLIALLASFLLCYISNMRQSRGCPGWCSKNQQKHQPTSKKNHWCLVRNHELSTWLAIRSSLKRFQAASTVKETNKKYFECLLSADSSSQLEVTLDHEILFR